MREARITAALQWKSWVSFSPPNYCSVYHEARKLRSLRVDFAFKTGHLSESEMVLK